MSKKRTDKSRYESKFAPDTFVTEAQYLAEIACERWYRRESVTLPIRFWESDSFKKEFMKQIILANRLLKKYDCKTILRALNSKDGLRTFSLCQTPYFKRLLEIEKKKGLAEKASVVVVEKVSEPPLPSGTRQAFSEKKSLRDMLDG